MRVLVDECLPLWLAIQLLGHEVKTVQQMGWSSLKDGEILDRAEFQFAVFLTADRNLKHQQSLAGRKLAIIVLPSNRLTIVQGMVRNILTAMASIQPGDYIELLFSASRVPRGHD